MPIDLVTIVDKNHWNSDGLERIEEEIRASKYKKEELEDSVLELVKYYYQIRDNHEREMQEKQSVIWSLQGSPLADELKEYKNKVRELERDIENMESQDTERYIKSLERAIIRRELEKDA